MGPRFTSSNSPKSDNVAEPQTRAISWTQGCWHWRIREATHGCCLLHMILQEKGIGISRLQLMR
eukprot:4336314-Karenia_brevis.AAC.1